MGVADAHTLRTGRPFPRLRSFEGVAALGADRRAWVVVFRAMRTFHLEHERERPAEDGHEKAKRHGHPPATADGDDNASDDVGHIQHKKRNGFQCVSPFNCPCGV